MTAVRKTGRSYWQVQMRRQLVTIAAEGVLLAAMPTAEQHVLRPATAETIWSSGPAVYAYLLAAVLSATYLAVAVPLGHHCWYVVRRRFGLARGTPWRAFKTVARHVVGRCFLMLLFLVVILQAHHWGLWPWSVWTAVVLYSLAKIVGIPRRGPSRASGYDAYPLEDSDRLRPLMEFAIRHGFGGVQFLGLRARQVGREVIAAVSDGGRCAKVYLSDNLLDLMSDRELLAVLAHELGHKAHRHGRWGAGLFMVNLVAIVLAVSAFLHLLVPDPTDSWRAVYAAPVLVLVAWVAHMLAQPVILCLGRHHELRANEWALTATNDPAAFISAMEKLAGNNLVSGSPGWIEKLLFNTHPSLGRTIAQAESYAAGHNIELRS